MTDLRAVDPGELPFALTRTKPTYCIPLGAHPDGEDVAEGEIDPYDWIDLYAVPEEIERLVGPEEIVLYAPEATLVLDYPLDVPAVRRLRAADGRAFTRGELVMAIAATYRAIFAAEHVARTVPTPPSDTRIALLEQPRGDAVFCVRGHDFEDLGLSLIKVHVRTGHHWLECEVES